MKVHGPAQDTGVEYIAAMVSTKSLGLPKKDSVGGEKAMDFMYMDS
jgi:hypothetical protein